MHREATQEPTFGDSPTGEQRQLVVLQIGAEQYGVDIARVLEIIRLQPVTRVPRCASFVEGVINLRGNVIAVVDLRRRFGLPVAEHTSASRIVVVDVDGQVVGLLVDAVSEVLRVSSSVIDVPSPVVAGIDSDYLAAIARLPDRLVLVLDLNRVLVRDERRGLEIAA